MRLLAGEPSGAPWFAVDAERFLSEVLGLSGRTYQGVRAVVAIDGRSGSGKTSLATRLCQAMGPAATVVATDDLAWNEPMFGWEQLAADGVLDPFRRGAAVAYRPPAWDRHDRQGHIEVPTSATILLFEGVGAARRELVPLLDATIWVQSDFDLAEQRGLARDIAAGVNGDRAASIAFWQAWMSHEVPFLAQDRPWDRATAVVCGTPPHPPAPGDLLVGRRTGPGT